MEKVNWNGKERSNIQRHGQHNEFAYLDYLLIYFIDKPKHCLIYRSIFLVFPPYN